MLSMTNAEQLVHTHELTVLHLSLKAYVVI